MKSPYKEDTYFQKKVRRQIIKIAFVSFLIGALISGAAYKFYDDNQDKKEEDKRQQESEDIGEVIALKDLRNELAKIIEVDDDEPTIAEITDIESLRSDNPALYVDAENNDLLIVFQNKAIIFRPSTNKIISVYPLEDVQ